MITSVYKIDSINKAFEMPKKEHSIQPIIKIEPKPKFKKINREDERKIDIYA